MYRYISIILSMLILAIIFHNYHFQIIAQDRTYTCNNELNIFLFDYNHTTWQEYTEIIQAASCDVHSFWMQLEDMLGVYQPPNYIVQENASPPFITPYDFTNRTSNGACNIRPTFTNASYYCTSPYSIVIAEPSRFLNFLEWKQNQRETMIVVLVLAHEWSHHIQLSVLNDRNMPELQAECFVGSYFRYAVSNPSQTLIDFSQDDWNALMQVIPINDNTPMGDIDRWENISVGDRGRALRTGYQEGPSRCLSITETTGSSE